PDDADVLPELAQDLVVPAPEALAGRREDDDRDHSPEDAEHRQEAAQLVRPQVLHRLNDGFAHDGWSSSPEARARVRAGRLRRKNDLVALFHAVQNLDLR